MDLTQTRRNKMRAKVRLLLTASISGLALCLLFVTLGLAAPAPQPAQQALYPPIVTIDQPTAGQVLTTQQAIYLVQGQVQPGTLGGGAISAVSLTLDGGLTYSPVVATPPTWYYTWTLPVNSDWGSHTLQAQARDVSGTLGLSSQIIVWVDTAPPHNVTVTTPKFFEENPGFFGVVWSATDQLPISTYDVQYRIGSSPWVDWLTHTNQTSGVLGDNGELGTLALGSTVYVRVRARDGVGNLSGYSSPAITQIGYQHVYLPLLTRNYYRDTYEPNDSVGEAYGPLEPDVPYLSYIWSEDDLDDYYYIVLDQTRQVTIDLENIPAGADYDLYLYDVDLQPVAASAFAGTPSEQIHETLSAGIYYIRVYPFMGYNNTSPYSIRVTHS